MTYTADWESLDQRPCPPWFDEAKFGIFIHWGVYSVPSWAPRRHTVKETGEAYAEWYWAAMQDKSGPYYKHHVETYGEDFPYQEFAPMFKAEMFDPAEWADLFGRAGARYVVLTSKHHDGYCLWPSSLSWNWNSVDVGPRRDLVGQLTEAVRAKGLKMGLYYSLYEWFRPLYHADPRRYAREHMKPQLIDLVERYRPSVLFADGEWDHPSDVWDTPAFLAWLFNESPVKDEVVVNDRWGKETRSVHGGYFTTEYGEVGGGRSLGTERKWEENRGIGASFGYNRNERLEDYLTPQQLIHTLINTVSAGGNLLLNVGPTADGRIPVIMQERLLQIGEWLSVNGEAIYGTRPLQSQRSQAPASNTDVRFTTKGDTLYAICLKWPGDELVLPLPDGAHPTRVSLLGGPDVLVFERVSGGISVQVPRLAPDELKSRYAYVFKIASAL